MIKGFSISALVVALVASTAVAGIQKFDMDQTNFAFLQGDGAASNTNWGILSESQMATDDVRHTTAFQGFNGALTQTAAAVGSNALFYLVGQDGDLKGKQWQNPYTGQQGQQIGSDLDQSVLRMGGNGSVLGVQTAVGIGTQLIFTPYGATANVQALGDVVYGAAAGGPCGSTSINGGSIIGLGQTQL